MTNNDILRTLRYTFDFSDHQMIDIIALVGKKVTRDEICSWLKKEEDPSFVACTDEDLSCFLDAFIFYKRGKQENPRQAPKEPLTGNIILKKIKIALNLQSDDMMSILQSVDIKMSKHELSALFRQKDSKNYRDCKDQFLRSFLKGLKKKYRP